MLLTVRINNNDNNNDNGIDSDEDSIWDSGNNKDIDTGSENDKHNAIGKVDANDNIHTNASAIDSVLDSLRVILLFLHVITNSLTFGLIPF